MLQGFRLVRAVQIAAAMVGALCLLGLSAALGRGLPLLSKLPTLLSAGAVSPSLSARSLSHVHQVSVPSS
jgi:hypothetical protein